MWISSAPATCSPATGSAQGCPDDLESCSWCHPEFNVTWIQWKYAWTIECLFFKPTILKRVVLWSNQNFAPPWSCSCLSSRWTRPCAPSHRSCRGRGPWRRWTGPGSGCRCCRTYSEHVKSMLVIIYGTARSSFKCNRLHLVVIRNVLYCTMQISRFSASRSPDERQAQSI